MMPGVYLVLRGRGYCLLNRRVQMALRVLQGLEGPMFRQALLEVQPPLSEEQVDGVLKVLRETSRPLLELVAQGRAEAKREGREAPPPPLLAAPQSASDVPEPQAGDQEAMVNGGVESVGPGAGEEPASPPRRVVLVTVADDRGKTVKAFLPTTVPKGSEGEQEAVTAEVRQFLCASCGMEDGDLEAGSLALNVKPAKSLRNTMLRLVAGVDLVEGSEASDECDIIAQFIKKGSG
jgi:hypothetical protein